MFYTNTNFPFDPKNFLPEKLSDILQGMDDVSLQAKRLNDAMQINYPRTLSGAFQEHNALSLHSKLLKSSVVQSVVQAQEATRLLTAASEIEKPFMIASQIEKPLTIFTEIASPFLNVQTLIPSSLMQQVRVLNKIFIPDMPNFEVVKLALSEMPESMKQITEQWNDFRLYMQKNELVLNQIATEVIKLTPKNRFALQSFYHFALKAKQYISKAALAFLKKVSKLTQISIVDIIIIINLVFSSSYVIYEFEPTFLADSQITQTACSKNNQEERLAYLANFLNLICEYANLIKSKTSKNSKNEK